MLFCPLFAQAQWVNYVSYDQSPMLLNPALRVLPSEVQINTSFRSQAIGESNRIQTGSASFIKTLMSGRGTKQSGAVGGQIIHQTAGPEGVLATTGVMLNYNYLVRFKQGYFLSMGLQGGVINRRLNTDVFFSENQFQGGSFNPGLPLGENLEQGSGIFPTFGAGLTWFYQDYNGVTRAWLGAATYNINQPDQSFTAVEDRLPVRLVVNGGVSLYANEFFAVLPNVRVIHEAGSNLVHVGSWFRYFYPSSDRNGHVGAGFWISPDNTVAGSFEYNQGVLGIVLGAEIPFSGKYDNLQVANALEIALTWNLGSELSEQGARTSKSGGVKRKVRYKIRN